MSLNLGLPSRGSDVTVFINRVHSHPLCGFAEFWCKFNVDRTAEYQWLANDIQSAQNFFQKNEGDPGEECLVQVHGIWQRSRIVSRFGPSCKVFLIDKGEQCNVSFSKMAWGKKEHFYLPPEVEFCVLANVLPLSPDNKWSPTALEFLKTLSGQSAKAFVQDVQVTQRTVFLHIPSISKQMFEMGFARKVSPECFQELVFTSLEQDLQTDSDTLRFLMKSDLTSSLLGVDEPQQLFTYPDLELGTAERVIVTEVKNPLHLFCQLNVFSFALKKLSEQMMQFYEDRVFNCDISETVGIPCAARGDDGQWYRSVIHHFSQTDREVEVFAVDTGKKLIVRLENVKPLIPEFIRMPIVTYKCSMHGIMDESVRWTRTHIDCLRGLLLNRTLSAKFEHQSVSKGVYYVTLFDADNNNLNHMFGLKERILQAEPWQLWSSDPDINLRPERAHGQTNAKARMASHSASQNPDVIPAVAFKSNGHILKVKNIFKEQMFPVGSDLEVTVSCIKSPNDFWCQLAQKAGLLKLLMQNMQSFYEGSQFEPFAETACVVRHPENRMWHRAVIIHQHEGPSVDVLLVDYGQKKTVSLYDARKMQPQFQALEGQAFRCSLLNPTDPSSVINDWGEEATAKFTNFVETATFKYLSLKSTVYAVTYNERNVIFNIVDLATPFENVCTCMVNLSKSLLPKTSGPPPQLDTFYYSTHNIKTGSEEMVMVTCVNTVHSFHCQLLRNADVVRDIDNKVNEMCNRLQNVKAPAVLGTLCLAKYTDGNWYRAQIKATEPSLIAHFVDYGDIVKVDKSDVCPIPKEAKDIISLPVQAVKCGLAGLPANVSTEVNHWFVTNMTERKFRALIVAREADGKLLVELYLGNTQVNTKVKRMFYIENHMEEQGILRRDPVETSGRQKQKNFELQLPKPASHSKDEGKSAEIDVQFFPKVFPKGMGCRGKAGTLELYKPPYQRRFNARTPAEMRKNSVPAGSSIEPAQQNYSTDSKQLVQSELPMQESCKKSCKTASFEKIPKISDLPTKPITQGMETKVLVSHCNSPLSFFLQFESETDEITSLVEKLNVGQPTLDIADITQLQQGDLIQAEFPDDSSWYRAFVREIHKDLILVEFLDFGNTALILPAKIRRLPEQFLEQPPYCVHCMLSEFVGLRNEVLHPDMVSAFKTAVSEDVEKVLKCTFRREGMLWEVDLEDNGVAVSCKCAQDLDKGCDQTVIENLGVSRPAEVKTAPLNVPSPQYCELNLAMGHHMDAYLACFNNDWSFWCMSARSEELDRITASMSEVGNAADQLPDESLIPGSPCIALYTEDNLWYRAQVIGNDEEKLSVLFIDYGNQSKVDMKNVRQVPPQLLEIPPQAFLCELEGLDLSENPSDRGAFDEFAELTVDKLLQLTILDIKQDGGKRKYIVEMECDGQAILKTLKKVSKMENNPNQGQLAAPEPFKSPEQSTLPEADFAAALPLPDDDFSEPESEKSANEPLQVVIWPTTLVQGVEDRECDEEESVPKCLENIDTEMGSEPQEVTNTTQNMDTKVLAPVEDLSLPDDSLSELQELLKVVEPASEQKKMITSTQEKDVGDGASIQVPDHDGFELLLSMVSHLTLTVVDDLDDTNPLQQPKEESPD